MSSRLILLCLALAAAFCCLFLALLQPPAQGHRPRPGGLSSGGRRLHVLRATTGPHFDTATEPAKEQRRGAPARKTTRWSAVAAGSVRPELRAVPGGPDPLHHHGGSPSRRPEQDDHTPSSP